MALGDWGGGAGAGIAQTLEELGRIRAQQATQQGQIWGSTIANIGQNVGQAIEQAPVRAALAQERQARALELQGLAQDQQQKAQALAEQRAGDAALAQAISNPANRDPQTGQVDPLKVQQEVAGKGFADHGQKYVAAATATAKNAQELAAMKQAAADKERQVVSDAFTGADPTDHTDLIARLGALQHQGVDMTPYAQELEQAGPTGWAAVLKRWNDTAPENVKAARTRAEKAAEEAAKVQFGPPGSAILQGGQVIGYVPEKTPEPSLTQESVLLDGKPALVNHNQKTGRWTLATGEDVSDRVVPLPPASVTYPKPDDAPIELTPAGLDAAALQFKRTGQLPPMGMGKEGARVRAQIINRSSTLTPADEARVEAGGLDIAANRAGYGADTASLKKLQGQRDAIGAFENTAGKNIDLYLDAAGKVVDTGSPMANSLARAVSGRMLGSPDQAKFDAARQVAINEIARITNNPNLAGTLSDSARREVEAFNPANATVAQTVAVMRLLKQDMGNRKTSLDAAIADVKKRISGGAGASDTQTPSPPATAPAPPGKNPFR